MKLHELCGYSPDFTTLVLASITQLNNPKSVLTRRENLELLQQRRPDCESTMKCLGLAYQRKLEKQRKEPGKQLKLKVKMLRSVTLYLESVYVAENGPGIELGGS
jgi:UDP-N-acetyl-D-mannosaminuronate dehydrogenase